MNQGQAALREGGWRGGALMMMRGISLPLGNTGLSLGSDLCLWLLLHICVCVCLLRPTTKRMFACSGASVTHRGICATPPVDGQSSGLIRACLRSPVSLLCSDRSSPKAQTPDTADTHVQGLRARPPLLIECVCVCVFKCRAEVKNILIIC